MYLVLVIVGVLVLSYIFISLLKMRQGKGIYDKIYFDNNSTTQPHSEVIRAMSDAAYLGNASASYSFGAALALDDLRSRAVRWLVLDPTQRENYQVIITSGASEANNFIIRSTVDAEKRVKPCIILSSMEHKTSLDCAQQLSDEGRANIVLVEPDIFGVVQPADVLAAIVGNANVALVSIMAANNESGSVNDIKSIASICSAHSVPFHTDAVQMFGKSGGLISDKVSALSMSFHKMNGPMGLGLLVLRKDLGGLKSQIAGSQNGYLRGGTENVPAIVGASVAMDITLANRDAKNSHLLRMKNMIVDELRKYFTFIPYTKLAKLSDDAGLALVKSLPPVNANKKEKAVVILGPVDAAGNPDSSKTLPNTLFLAIINLRGLSGVDDNYKRFCNIKLKSDLAARDVLISIGSACLTGEQGPSHVLKALQAPYIVRCGVFRVSLGDYNTESQCHQFIKKLVDAAWIQ